MSDNKLEKDKAKADLGHLEEDDEFEEFPAESKIMFRRLANNFTDL